jgi:hypothetical protein
MNRFGKAIREDILNLSKIKHVSNEDISLAVGREVAGEALRAGLSTASQKNSGLLQDAIDRIDQIEGTALFKSSHYAHYQTRDRVMMVKEERR